MDASSDQINNCHRGEGTFAATLVSGLLPSFWVLLSMLSNSIHHVLGVDHEDTQMSHRVHICMDADTEMGNPPLLSSYPADWHGCPIVRVSVVAYGGMNENGL